MSDADSAGSHGRASKARRSAGGHVARVRQQFEAPNALPSPSARATVSAPQVPAAKNAPKDGRACPSELATPFRQQNSGSKRASSSKRQRLSERVQSCPPKHQSKVSQSKACFGSTVVKVGNVNVRTLAGKEAHAGKAEFLAEELSRLSIALCGLCEVRWPGQGQKQVGAYSVHYSGGTTKHHGVALALSQAASQCLFTYQ
ncbi:TPA: hypothetical protein ACH3X1_009170 [Trebouxia sp. C0004]